MIPDTFIATAIELIRQSGEEHYLPVRGVSMRPFLYDGDMVLVTPDKAHLQRGDIVVYQASGLLITHRVLLIKHSDKKGTTYMTKGDNSVLPDPPIISRVIIGEVVAIRRNNREMRLDNRRWQLINHLIGTMMLLLVKLYSVVIGARPVKPGEELGLLYRLFRRGMLTISFSVIKLLQFIIGRWTPYNAHEGKLY